MNVSFLAGEASPCLQPQCPVTLERSDRGHWVFRAPPLRGSDAAPQRPGFIAILSAKHEEKSARRVKQNQTRLILFPSCSLVRRSRPSRPVSCRIVCGRNFRPQNLTYFSSLFSPTDSSTVICEMAIWFNFCRRSDCGIPSLIRTEFRDSILERQISWFTVA